MQISIPADIFSSATHGYVTGPRFLVLLFLSIKLSQNQKFNALLAAHFITRVIQIVTARKRSLGQGNIFVPVCHSVHRGVCFSAYPPPQRRTPPHPPEQTPPRKRHSPQGPDPPRSRHPPAQCMLGDTLNKQAVRILLECNLVTKEFASFERTEQQ